MKKHIFLTGASGSGKTTMIRKALGSSLSYAGGFVTERVLDESGQLLGFDLMPAASASGIGDFEKARFLDYSCTPPKANNEVFRNLGVRLLQEAEYYPYVLMDEFGGFELIIPQFREALLEILNSDVPCIGVLKGSVNGEQLRQSLGLGQKYTLYREKLADALKSDKDSVLLPITGPHDEFATKLLQNWVREYCP